MLLRKSLFPGVVVLVVLLLTDVVAGLRQVVLNQKHPSVPFAITVQHNHDSEDLKPGVGFALEMTYGTAAVRFANGTFKHIAFINGSDQYVELMGRLATGEGPKFRHRDPRDLTPIEYIEYLASLAKRRWRLARGLPATEEAEILIDMIRELRYEVEKAMNGGCSNEELFWVERVVVTSPDPVEHTHEEISDVLDFERLENLLPPEDWDTTQPALYSTNAAMAAYNLGLCKNFTNDIECTDEEYYSMDPERTFMLEYTTDYFLITSHCLQTVREPGPATEIWLNYDLGLKRLDEDEYWDPQDYWRAVTTRIQGFMAYLDQLPGPCVGFRHVVLAGAQTCDLRYLEALQKAFDIPWTVKTNEDTDKCWTDGDDEDPDNSVPHPAYVTARGAAEFAFRRQAQQQPDRIREKHEMQL